MKAWIRALPQSLWTCFAGSLCVVFYLVSRSFFHSLSSGAQATLAVLGSLLLGSLGYFLCRDVELAMKWFKHRAGEHWLRASVGAALALLALGWWLGRFGPVLYKRLQGGAQIEAALEKSVPAQANDWNHAVPDRVADRPIMQTAPAKNESPHDFVRQGIELYGKGKLDESIAAFNQAVSLCASAVDDTERIELAIGLSHRGLVQYVQARLPDVLRAYDRALGRRSGVKSLTYLDDLAIRDFDKAIDLCRELVDRDGHVELAAPFAQSLNTRAKIYCDRGNISGTLADFDDAVALCIRLTDEDGDRIELLPVLATGLAGRGSVALAQKRFDEAVADLGQAIDIWDRLAETSGGADFASELAHALADRAGALHDQDKVAEAANDYNRAIQLYTELVEKKARADLSHELAAALLRHDAVVRQLGKSPDNARDLEKATSLYSALVDGQGRTDLSSEFAASLSRRAHARIAQGQPQSIQDYDRAIALYKQLADQAGQSEWTNELAKSLHERGTARLGIGDVDAALVDYDAAVPLYRKLVKQSGQSRIALELIQLLNDRGNTLRARGRFTEAVGDFENAVAICSRPVDGKQQPEFLSSLAMSLNNRAIALADQGKLAESLEDYNKAIELYTSLDQQRETIELKRYLAATLNNRAVVWIRRRKTGDAVQDLEKAVDIYAPLAIKVQSPEIRSSLAVVLNTLARIYATAPEIGIHNPSKAIEYATRACELTEQKNPDMLRTLAIAYSATRNFHSAYYWQAKVAKLAPDDPDSAAMLEYYRLMKSRLRETDSR
jgi:tetratricopeptide (TPR) repeat protein